MWNRVEPKDIPKIEDLIGEENEDMFSEKSKGKQTVSDMEDVLRTFANKSKGGGIRGSKKC